MSIATPIDIVTPAVRRRQQLAQQIQAQYNQNRGGNKAVAAANKTAIKAMPLFAGGHARDSLTLPAAPLPQLTAPFMQDPTVTAGLGVVNPAQPNDPNVSQAPGQPAGDPSNQQPVDQISPINPNQPASPQAGQGQYANGAPATGPMANPNDILRTYGYLASVRRLYGGPGQQQGIGQYAGRGMLGIV